MTVKSHSRGEIHLASFEDCNLWIVIYEFPEVGTSEPDKIVIEETKDLLFKKVNVTVEDLSKIKESLPPLTYVAGYCAHSAIKKIKEDITQNYNKKADHTTFAINKNK